MALDPGVLFTGINNAFKLAKLCLELKEASEDVRTFGALIERVRGDRAEAIREYRETARILESYPHKKAWINGIINDVDKVLFQIGCLLEDARLDNELGKSISLQHRFEWVLSVKSEFLVKHALLSTCHQSMLSAITAMHGMRLSSDDLLVPNQDHEAEIPEEDTKPLRPPGLRRKRNKSGSFITYNPISSPSLIDECDKALDSAGQSADLETDDVEPEPSGKAIAESLWDNVWDDVEPREMAQAAANAIEKQGRGMKSVPSFAAPLRKTGAGDAGEELFGARARKMRLAARFTDN